MSLLWKTAFFIWLLTITVLSLMSHPPAPEEGVLAWDKLQHALAYALLTLLGALAFTFYRSSRAERFLSAAVTAVVIGGLLEIAQGMLTVVRSAEFGDLLADAAGAAAVTCLALFVNGRRHGERAR